jgi:hypothetical protein
MSCIKGEENNMSTKENCEKSINLIIRVHRLLIDSYSKQQQTHLNRSVFLVWLFAKLLKFYLISIDYLLKEGVFIDTKAEFGFKRNTDIKIQDFNYWSDGFLFLFKSLSYLQKCPLFMRVLVINSFKLCKYIQIIGLLNQQKSELDLNANLSKDFEKSFESIFKFLIRIENEAEKSIMPLNEHKMTYSNLLELSFKRIKINSKELEIIKNDEIEIENIFNKSLEDDNLYKLNIELEIDNFISSSFNRIISNISNILIKNLINNYYLFNFIEHLHSYTLFKTNELMFLFSKNLFELIKKYETYQDEMILNKIFYNISSNYYSVINNNKINKLLNSQKLFKIVYENDGDISQIINKKSPAKQCGGINISTRLISGIKLKFFLNWPYNLIIKESDIDVYNKYFILILQMKQVKYDLDSLDFKGIKTKFS